MFEQIVYIISTYDITIIFGIAILFSVIENLFPPTPSDLVVILGAVALSHINQGVIRTDLFIYYFLATSIFSSIGFMIMYYVGYRFGDDILRKDKIKFIKKKHIDHVDYYFNKYGYKVILLNRFLPGTRSAVSFFAGLAKLHLWHTFIYATLSALGWNILIVYLGFVLGGNIKAIDSVLNTYGTVGTIITILLVIVGYFIYKYKKK
ncbi:MAG TPA: DedA family protein [Ignavibacteriales bacterium]|nr:DedA family protein [Ignavibacteriales bacterium]HOL82190.1 DedA family protein [Ignavibacteriales bacterium]HOM66312.1 DedA family protein [Ignavibacteriales bacterium]HPD67991.1 DedA family protein [Ignavibacteriales bacterium]HPP34431.1 DedA family protein [Ignavibacteriales bacterium]